VNISASPAIGPADLIVRGDHLHLMRTAKENWTRPAINPLFRTAATAFGPRTAAVLLTGTMDDGTAGILAIEAVGGVIIVQDPEDAEFPEMPQSALQYLDPDHVVRLAELPQLLDRLARAGADEGLRRAGQPMARPDHFPAADALDAVPPGARQAARSEKPSGLTCPECGGSLWEHEERGFTDYRCRIGHRFSPKALARGQGEVRANLLEASLRSIREEQALAEQLLARGRERFLAEGDIRRRQWQIGELERLGDEIETAIRGPAGTEG